MTDGNGRDLTLPANDPFLQYGGGGGGATAGATLLLYSKGEYNVGQDKVFVPLGTKMVFFMPGVRTGYRHWNSGQIDDDDMMPLVDRPRVPPRSNYGDNDKATWRDNQDPWQETIMIDVTTSDGSLYTFPLSNVGGLRAGRGLILEYGKQRRSRPPGQLPIVELGSDSYQHPKFGKTPFPVLTIVGWVDGETLEPVEDVGGGDLPWAGGDAASVETPTAKPVEPAVAAPAAAAARPAAPKRTGGPRF